MTPSGSVFDHLRGGRRGGVESVRLEHLRQAIELHEERRKLADLLSQADLPRLVARYVLPSPLFTDGRSDTIAPHHGGGNNKFASLEDTDGLLKAHYGDTALFIQLGLKGSKVGLMPLLTSTAQ